MMREGLSEREIIELRYKNQREETSPMTSWREGTAFQVEGRMARP
jgi:hypothetical protein